MKIKDGFVVRKIAGQYMAVPVGARTKAIHGMIALNETGAFIWNLLSTEQTENDLVDAILNEYDVDREHATISVKRFLEKMEREDLLI
mgnify:CR=1 FL=1